MALYDPRCASYCNRCSESGGRSAACAAFRRGGACDPAGCPPALFVPRGGGGRSPTDLGGGLFGESAGLRDALRYASSEGFSCSAAAASERFAAGELAAQEAEEAGGGSGGGGAGGAPPDRDDAARGIASARGAALAAAVPPQFANREDVWGGGLRRMASGGVGPRREDDHYRPARYVPIGFARYENPNVDPADYAYYLMSGWRVAVPRTLPGPAVRALLARIYQYGPSSAGYARLGDTIVPAILGPGDRQTLAQSSSRLGPASRKYPLA